MINRKQKIDLLKGIAKGERSIKELEPTTYDVWLCLDGETYFNNKTGVSLSIAEYIQRNGKDTISVTLNIE